MTEASLPLFFKGVNRVKDITGEKFGKLVVVKFDINVGKHSKWICICDCGKEVSCYRSNLVGKKSKSCGCKSEETIEKIRAGATKHGMSRTKTYKAWIGMKGRCLNEKYSNYPNYGGRGIKVCERWLESFENFFADMGECPDGMSIDRKDNNDDYKPENCRWSTDQEQMNNRRVTTYLSAFGKTMTLLEWAGEMGVPKYVIRNRIKSGWSAEDALSTPRKEYSKHD